MQATKIRYKQVRDLGAIFGATFGFIRQNFKPLYGSLLFFAGPVLMVGAIISTYMMGSTLGMAGIFSGTPEKMLGNFALSYITSMLIIFIGITVFNVILYRNIQENEKLGQDEPLTIKHATINFMSDFLRMLGSTFLLMIVTVIAFVVIGLLFAGLFALGGGDNSSGAIAMVVIFVILLFLFFLILGPIISFVPLASLFVSHRDESNIFTAMRKVFYYMKENFWSTWIVSFVGLLAYMLMATIVQIPMYIITFITAFSRVKTTVGYGLEDQSTPFLLILVTAATTMLSYGVMVVYHLIVVYQYGNLEEKKEGTSILEKINQID